MSPPVSAATDRSAKPARRAVKALALSIAAALGAVLSLRQAGAQTIADFSRSQRLLLEATMAQNAQRLAALNAAAAASAASAPAAASAPPRLPRPVALPEPILRVSGAFVSGSRRLAEVAVDGHGYLLTIGDVVPGTGWRVAAIAADQVVLDRGGAAHAAGDSASPFSRAFPLASGQ